MGKFKKFTLMIFVTFYLVAGVNHFRSPKSYLHIIPAYMPYPKALNMLAGTAEIALALLMIRPQSRKVASYGTIAMLIAFLPVHIQMVIDAPVKLGSFIVTPMIAWIRLVLLQPLLILWAWWLGRYPDNGEPSR